MKAKNLIVFNRIDLVAKMKYIEFREKGFEMGFVKELYKKHIEAFNFGKASHNNRRTIETYLKEFDQLIDAIKENGFDDTISVIPVGAKNTILDGVHRTAIAAYFDMEVSIVRFEELYVNYDAQFFKARLLDEKYLDYLVTEYCKLKENLFFACVWPRAKGKIQEVENRLKQSTNIVYEKSVSLSYQGLRNFMVQIYGLENWIGTIENGFKGVKRKADACFDSDGNIRCYVLESENLEKIVEMKRDIRSIFQIGDHSIHICDDQSESIQVCNLLLNGNSVHFLNNGKPHFYKKFYSIINTIKNTLKCNNVPLEEFIFCSSSIMGLYGLREPEKIGFMTVSNEAQVIESEMINKCNDNIHFYNTSIDVLVLNPANYFVYNDLKFTTIDLLKKFKQSRNEKKDQVDIKLMNTILNRKKPSIEIFNRIKRSVRALRQLSKIGIKLLLGKIGLYNKVKRIYSSFRGNKNKK